MRSSEILSLLKEYPDACYLLGYRTTEFAVMGTGDDRDRMLLHSGDKMGKSSRFMYSLIGHSMIEIDRLTKGDRSGVRGPIGYTHPTGRLAEEAFTTRLEACLSALQLLVALERI